MPSDGHEFTYNVNLRLIGDPRTDEILCLLRTLLQGQRAQGFAIMAVTQQVRDLITEFDTATNNIATRITALEQKITDGGMSAADEAAALTELAAIKDRLKVLGADPNNPVPPEPPVPTP